MVLLHLHFISIIALYLNTVLMRGVRGDLIFPADCA